MEKYRIIVDTNLWISLLIGKRLSELYNLCNSEDIDVFIYNELIEEFVKVSSLEKIRKYANEERVTQTLDLMKASCILSSVEKDPDSSVLRDVNDLFLLGLAETIKADYILTGDKDLLSLQSYQQTKIVTYKEFAAIYHPRLVATWKFVAGSMEGVSSGLGGEHNGLCCCAAGTGCSDKQFCALVTTSNDIQAWTKVYRKVGYVGISSD